MSISTVTSEALQLKLRQLLPSQQGFGTDISASDTIIPIIDLTAAAEGSDVPEYLQTALAFGSQTAFEATNATVTIINTTGFYRIVATATTRTSSSADRGVSFALTDGSTTKVINNFEFESSGDVAGAAMSFDFVVFCAVGESCTVTSTSAGAFVGGSVRQVADVNGTLVQPSGFTPQ
jgi:hypothetical protein